MEKERVGVRQRQLEQVRSLVDDAYTARHAERLARARTGKVVVKPNDRGWEQSQMGHTLFYLDPYLEDTSVQDWSVFIHDIHSTSGTHRHQGGLVIFVLEGNGATIMDGKKYEWEKGDLILLPIKPGGIEHQHLNFSPDGSAKWMAFIYEPVSEAVGTEVELLQESVDWVKATPQ